MDGIITQISSAELLQTDATIIAGVLVLLTISVIYDKKIHTKFWGLPAILCALMPIGFILSATLLLLGSITPANAETYYQYAVLSFVLSLFFLMISVLVIVALLITRKRETPANSD